MPAHNKERVAELVEGGVMLVEPCPDCGGNHHHFRQDLEPVEITAPGEGARVIHRLVCDSPGCGHEEWGASKAEAIGKWNRGSRDSWKRSVAYRAETVEGVLAPLTCPSCGSTEVTTRELGLLGPFRVECDRCATQGLQGVSRRQAVEKWNQGDLPPAPKPTPKPRLPVKDLKTMGLTPEQIRSLRKKLNEGSP